MAEKSSPAKSYESDDVWDEEGTDLDIALRSTKREEEEAFKAGFRESSDGDNVNFEAAFREGFKAAFVLGLKLGQVQAQLKLQESTSEEFDEKKCNETEVAAKVKLLQEVKNRSAQSHFGEEGRLEMKTLTVKDLLQDSENNKDGSK